MKCTPDHPFLTDSGWKFAEHLEEGSLIRSTLTPTRSISTATFIACGIAKDIYRRVGQGFTGTFGNSRLAKSLKAATSIIETAIRLITASATSSAETRTNTFLKLGMVGSEQNTFLTSHEQKPPSGTPQKKGSYGTADTPSSRKGGKNGNELRRTALFAGPSSSGLKEKAEILKYTVLQIAKPLVIENVTRLDTPSDVWCLHVPGDHNFSLANGAVVHNSDGWRTVAVSWRRSKAESHPVLTTEQRLIAGNVVGMTMGQIRQQHLDRKAAMRDSAA